MTSETRSSGSASATMLDATRRLAESRHVHIEESPEPPPRFGAGEAVDVLVFGRLPPCGPAQKVPLALEVAQDLTAVAGVAFPEPGAEVHVEAPLMEPALFQDDAPGADLIRLRFRVLAATRSDLQAWRDRLRRNVKALGLGGHGHVPGTPGAGEGRGPS